MNFSNALRHLAMECSDYVRNWSAVVIGWWWWWWRWVVGINVPVWGSCSRMKRMRQKIRVWSLNRTLQLLTPNRAPPARRIIPMTGKTRMSVIVARALDAMDEWCGERIVIALGRTPERFRRSESCRAGPRLDPCLAQSCLRVTELEEI